MRKLISTILVITFLMLSLSDTQAKPVDKTTAEKVVKGWLRSDLKRMGTQLGDSLSVTEAYGDVDGEPAYYVVYLKEGGFVITPADDSVEPIIAFVEKGTYIDTEERPLGALVRSDIPARVKLARQSNNERSVVKEAGRKWKDLLAVDEGLIEPMGYSSVSDIRVAPIVQSKWGQTTIGHYIGYPACYNYYTPPGPDGDSDNYPCGCVATAMVQLMRYYEYPGSYSWNDMPLVPTTITPEYQRATIGDLCRYAADAIGTTYSEDGSSASLKDACDELRYTFSYSNSIYGDYPSIGSALNKMVNPNLDAKYPVLLGLSGGAGHAVVCDGYGYNGSTLYHHLNMGWDGDQDAWYNLPTVDSSPAFTSIHGCAYNIFVSGSGEIISGRITDMGGTPIGDVQVTASGGGTYYGVTNSNGIYAIAKVPYNTTYTLSAAKGSWSFSNQVVNTGHSVYFGSNSGNVWAANFNGTISAGFLEFDKESYQCGQNIGIKLVDTDLLGNGSADVTLKCCSGDYETVSLTESPSSSGVFTGSLSTANTTAVTENGVFETTSSVVVIGTYADADDGTGIGRPTTDTALLGIRQTIYETNFTGGCPGDWTIVDGGASSDTWTDTNPGSRSNSNWTGTFMIADSDYAYQVEMDEQLISCSIDCSNFTSVKLSFRHYFYYWEGDWYEIGDVDFRINGGTWQNLARYEGADASGLVELFLPETAANQQDVQIRWHYYDAYWEYYWGIDDVQVTGMADAELTSGDFEPDCKVDFFDFSILAQAWMKSSGEAGFDERCDISDPADDTINSHDLESFVENWLATQ